MLRFLIAILLTALFGTASAANDRGTGLFVDLEFVSDTDVPGINGQSISLCHTTDDIRLLGVTLLSNITGYALSDDNCGEDILRRLTPNEVAAAQEINLIDPALPTLAKNDVRRNLTNYGLWIAIIMGLVAVIIRRVKALLGYDLRGPMRRKSTQRIVSAMCHAGQRDGIVDSKEIALIRRAGQRLTRRSIRTAEIVKIADHAKADLSDQDFIAFGRGLRDGEKDVMMRGVFYVTLASGRLLPAEHEFLSRLAYGIGMPGEDFRRVMNVALTDLDRFPPR